MTHPAPGRYGVVVIGRNEGERLRQCLNALDPRHAPLVYVDSGSSDGSVALAEGLGAHVVALDMTVPFTAARARNSGFARLMELAPDLDFVQFVDGDCEIADGWLGWAMDFLDSRPELAAVGGRLHERYPERSIYNQVCEISWQWKLGDTRAVGGVVMLRTAAMKAVGGYDGSLIAGEESELCIRLRSAGWKIWQADVRMAMHDANMLHFDQWWRRSVRTGYAYAQGAAMNGAPPEQHWVRETRSACVWGAAVPLAAVAALAVTPWLTVAILALYPVQVARIYARSPLPREQARLKAVFLMMGKFPEAWGVAKYFLTHQRSGPHRLIEYK
jgi:GT2 family glycosyltransferase